MENNEVRTTTKS